MTLDVGEIEARVSQRDRDVRGQLLKASNLTAFV
jgi:hypothetical protein